MQAIRALSLLFVSCPWVAAAAFAQGGAAGSPGGDPPATHECPDVKASQVDGSTEAAEGATVKTCGIGLVVFGFGGGIVGESCPSTQVKTPAHQACKGEVSEGKECLQDDDVPVTASDCQCGGLIIPGISVGIPIKCKCGDSYPFGTVEDAKTADCPPDR